MDYCFNPCFRGTRPRTAPDMNAAAAWITVSILVFVELALGRWHAVHGKLADADVSILVFVELALGLKGAHCLSWLAMQFQSLFSWNSPSDSSDYGYQHHSEVLVSILVFVELALGHRLTDPLAAALTPSFNPCFRGTRPRTSGQGQSQSLPAILVSILVFVELALGLYSYLIGSGQRGSFNPCFRGTRPRTIGRKG